VFACREIEDHFRGKRAMRSLDRWRGMEVSARRRDRHDGDPVSGYEGRTRTEHQSTYLARYVWPDRRPPVVFLSTGNTCCSSRDAGHWTFIIFPGVIIRPERPAKNNLPVREQNSSRRTAT